MGLDLKRATVNVWCYIMLSRLNVAALGNMGRAISRATFSFSGHSRTLLSNTMYICLVRYP